MSRIGNLIIKIPTGVEVKVDGKLVTVKSSNKELQYTCPDCISCKVEGDICTLTRENDSKEQKSLHGLARSLVNNMVEGVYKGFEKKLEVIGVGYKVDVKGKNVVLSLGFSHDINYTIPEGIDVSVEKEKNHIITIKGISKQLVGQVASEIRKFRPPEPYKGKGIRYTDEHVVRKEGKRVAAA